MAKKKRTEKQAAEDMVIDQIDPEVNKIKGEKEPPTFQVIGERIRVSKAFGKNVERRKDAALFAMEIVRNAWDEAYRYYNHNQVRDDEYKTQPRPSTFRRGDSYENLVFANTSVMIPAIYSKNPDVNFVTDDDDDKPFVECLSKAVNALFNKKIPRGINLKPRMKKAALHAELTNLGVVKLDYIEKDDSVEKANTDLNTLFQEMEKAENVNKVKELEGQAMAIESNIEWMEPSGFKLGNVVPLNLIVDPAAENEDGSDAWWMLEEIYLATSFLNAKFTKKDNEGRVLLYKPTHKIKLGGDGTAAREDALGLVLETIEGGVTEKKAYIDEQQQNYIYQNMTKCWLYWERATRRCFLFTDDDMTWPVWVWEDNLKLSRFFPYFFVQFYPATGGMTSPGEASYYLDQQDEINTINAEMRRIRRMIFSILVYNKNKVKPDDAAKLISYLKGDNKGENALGIDVPEGLSLKDAMETLAPPSINYEAIFNKQPIYSVVDRLSSTSDALRGAQFKSNTTQDAVQAYMSAAQLRVANRTDAIEDCVADVAWAIAEILVQKADKEYIAGLVGAKYAAAWSNMSVDDLNANYTIEVAAGSSEKPTSMFKKREAIEIAQGLGQFARAAPGSTLRVVLKLLESAFPELSITQEDWKSIDDEIQANLQRGVSTGAGAGGGGTDMEQLLMSLPPEAKADILQKVNGGMNPQEAIAPYIGDSNGQAPQ